LRILLEQNVVSENATRVFLEAISNQPMSFLVNLVEDKESLSTVFHQLDISPGFDYVGITSALKKWFRELGEELNKKHNTIKPSIEKNLNEANMDDTTMTEGSDERREKNEPTSEVKDALKMNIEQAESSSRFLDRININNTTAKGKLIASGYATLANLGEVPPNLEELAEFGFNTFESNKILKYIKDLTQTQGISLNISASARRHA